MPTTTSTNMMMPVPVVGSESGPQWATDLNACLTIIDQHDHTSGNGVPITPSGLDINSTLTMQGNSLTNAGQVAFSVQSVDPSTLGAFYYKGVDIYFNDGSGNHIRMTQSGSVSGATGTITGLPSGTASASYNAGTFVFQSATNTAASIDGQNFILRNSTASSNGLTLSPPNAMGSDYSITLPAVPATTSAVNMTSGGVMGTITYDNIGVGMTSTGANAVANTRTRATGTTVAAGGVAISSSSGSFSNSGGGVNDVTNLSVTITTSGRPVEIRLVADGAGSGSSLIISDTSNNPSGTLYFYRGGVTVVAQYSLYLSVATSANTTLRVPMGSVCAIDPVAAGTYTYKMAVSSTGTTTVQVTNAKLIVYEL